MIIGILGFRGTGKDTVADILTQRTPAQKIGFADALKRTCREVFDFSYEQLWGTQEEKEAPDFRYPREHSWYEDYFLIEGVGQHLKCRCCGYLKPIWVIKEPQQCYLNARYAMQILGTEGARHCWSNIWVHKAIAHARQIEDGMRYSQEFGLEVMGDTGYNNAIFIDNRFINEVEGIWDAGGRVYRIKRPGFGEPAYNHPSETEQLRIPDGKLQGVIMNDGTLEDLKNQVCSLLGEYLRL